jgi:hypothetical protein
VVDEDILDGTVANEHKTIILTSVDYLDPQVIAALEDYAAHGGLVLPTGDSTVTIKGAKKLAFKPPHHTAAVERLVKILDSWGVNATLLTWRRRASRAP